MPTNRFFPKQSLASLGVFLPKFARFLMNNLMGFTGPAWTCAFTYSSAAGTPFQVPPTPSDMGSLNADNGWRTGTIVVGDYVILNSASAANKFQLGIAYQGANTFRIVNAPYQGFDTTAHKTTVEDAANWLQPRISNTDYGVNAGASNYNVVADEDRIIFCNENGVTYSWCYIGKIDNTATGDNNCSINYVIPTQTYASNNGGILGGSAYRRISTIDNATEIALNGVGAMRQDVVGDMCTTATNYLKDNVTNEFRGMPIYVFSNTPGHIVGMGSLRGVYLNNTGLSGVGKGTIGNKAYAFMCNNPGTSPIIFDWDSTTVI